MVGNASEKDLRRILAEVQNFRNALHRLLPGVNFGSDRKTILIGIRDPASFQRFAPRDGRGRRQQGVGGYFIVLPYGNVMVLPMYANREVTYQVTFHEYVHYLIYRNMRNVPTWLHEGLAEFYSTFFVDGDGRGIVGRAPAKWIKTLRSRPLVPLARFLDSETWTRLFNDAMATEILYAQSWAFVHFMTLSDNGSRQGQILRYLEAMQTASSQAAAAKQAFGTDLARLGEDLEQWVRRFQLPAIAIPPAEQASGGVATVEPLTEADALHLQGRLLAELRATEDADEMLSKALIAAPGHLGARVALGRVRLQQERRDEGIDLLTAAAAEAEGEFEAQYYLAAALGTARRHEESIKAYDRALTINGQSPDAWFGLSVAALAMNRVSQSEAAMRQVQGRYSDPSWYFSRARFALGRGLNEAAARDIGEYLTQAGWGDDSAPYAAFIGAIAHWRLNQPAEADALLVAAERAARPKSWTSIVVQYLRNQLADDAFLDRAKHNGQRTEAHAYIGVRLLLAGRIEDARKHFVWVKTRGDRNYTEYDLALAELERLDTR